jgi:hypothetical protein
MLEKMSDPAMVTAKSAQHTKKRINSEEQQPGAESPGDNTISGSL